MYTPRLTKEGMLNSKYWYSNTNPFYASNWGLPNCTCYAWGRFWETYGVVPHLPTGDGGEWWGAVSGYNTGAVPHPGAVLCLERPGYAGHVCIVEYIDDNGNAVCSNSGYSRNPGGYDDPDYFWVSTQLKSLGYLTQSQANNGYRFQGFIYNPDYDGGEPGPGPGPSPGAKRKRRWKFYLYG